MTFRIASSFKKVSTDRTSTKIMTNSTFDYLCLYACVFESVNLHILCVCNLLIHEIPDCMIYISEFEKKQESAYIYSACMMMRSIVLTTKPVRSFPQRGR